ncbi:spermine/spermidine synthase domain-containing protein [Pseudoneobacillus sp. C159]
MEMGYSPSRIWLSDRLQNEAKPAHHHPVRKQEKMTQPTTMDPYGNSSWDRISLKMVKSGKHKNLYQGKSPYQQIDVVSTQDIRMYLNGQLQFSSVDERIYHEAFVHVPMSLASERKRVLIVGGGDGLALREVLKYKDVKSVDLVDIDDEVLDVARNVPEMVELNQRSMYDHRVQVHAMDALVFLKKNLKTYDVIIVDFPDPSEAVLANLYTVEVFKTLYRCLNDRGFLVCQSFSLDESPTVYWSIGRTMEAAGFHTKGYHTIIPSFDDWGFHLGAKRAIPNQIPACKVYNRTLPKNLSDLFHFHPEVLEYRADAVVNSKDHLQLHHIYRDEVI